MPVICAAAGRRWPGRLAAPVAWLVTRVTPTPEVQVISRSAVLLLQHGTPYLPPGQLADWLSYNPYLPVMAHVRPAQGAGRDRPARRPAGVADAVTSIALIWAAFAVAAPHRRCDSCRRSVVLSTVFFAASPVIAFPLAVGITDPPVIALMLLTLALIARPSGCSARPLAPRGRVRDEGDGLARRAGLRRDAGGAGRGQVGLALRRGRARRGACLRPWLSAPAALGHPCAFLQNTVLFPLGLTKHKTPAASPLPGHLLAMTGMAGHWAAVGAAGRGRARPSRSR